MLKWLEAAESAAAALGGAAICAAHRRPGLSVLSTVHHRAICSQNTKPIGICMNMSYCHYTAILSTGIYWNSGANSSFMGGQAYPVSLPASACDQVDQDTSKHATIMRKELHVPIFPVPSFAADAFSERIGDATLTGADCRLQTPGEFCKMDGLDSATGKLRLDWNETWHTKLKNWKH